MLWECGSAYPKFSKEEWDSLLRSPALDKQILAVRRARDRTEEDDEAAALISTRPRAHGLAAPDWATSTPAASASRSLTTAGKAHCGQERRRVLHAAPATPAASLAFVDSCHPFAAPSAVHNGTEWRHTSSIGAGSSAAAGTAGTRSASKVDRGALVPAGRVPPGHPGWHTPGTRHSAVGNNCSERRVTTQQPSDSVPSCATCRRAPAFCHRCGPSHWSHISRPRFRGVTQPSNGQTTLSRMLVRTPAGRDRGRHSGTRRQRLPQRSSRLSTRPASGFLANRSIAACRISSGLESSQQNTRNSRYAESARQRRHTSGQPRCFSKQSVYTTRRPNTVLSVLRLQRVGPPGGLVRPRAE
ncbi:hypothetical protein HPB48_001806 [Haemaphysalis longicornis]|uniref:Uncharacterized protein n=1 Tax=Haemaphysalis longicornis TaxID=44386 RepID=A0A9J6G5F8_HAELO|nr:hypothetical protein HPB48_001806 [Haemaphysalis longicornis]